MAFRPVEPQILKPRLALQLWWPFSLKQPLQLLQPLGHRIWTLILIIWIILILESPIRTFNGWMIISSDCSLYTTKNRLKTVEKPQNVLYKVYLRKTKTKKQIMPLFAANCQTSACLFHEKKLYLFYFN